jgi:phage major head subunit gpT-like protein
VVYNQDWEITIGVTHNAIDDDRAGDLEGWAKATAMQYEKHKDYLAFNALNTAAATTTLSAGYDGVALLSASHADPNAEYTTVQDNDFALSLSMSNLVTVKVAGSKFLNSRGLPLGLNHSLLITPPDLMYEAAQILTNSADWSTGNRAANPFSGKMQGLEAPGGWLDATAWFAVDPSMPQKPLYLQERKAPELIIFDDETQGDGGMRYYKWHSRYTIFPGDWRLIVGGNT